MDGMEKMEREWRIVKPDPALVRRIQRELACHPVTASVLVNRNIRCTADAGCFLNATLASIRPPFAIKDMDKAVRRIHRAITKGEKILIFGDYDVDGVTATAILLDFLRAAGAEVSYYIPHRRAEGYGLGPEHISGHAARRGIDLIITVDCGSGSHEAVEAAGAHGIDVVITDHHHISDPMPAATAVVNPKRPDCRAGFEDLAGVGVAFCLLISLRKHLRDQGFWGDRPEPDLRRLCDLVALGTVADVVPLMGENRTFSIAGLNLINAVPRPGIRALIQASGIKKSLTDAGDIAFRLAPRLNAAGRLDHARTALELLMAEEEGTAREIAESLNRLNRERRRTEKEILDGILSGLDGRPDLLEARSLVLAEPEWHEGVLGIVASRLADRFHRPVLLVSTRNGRGKGSGRSIPGIDLYAALRSCAEHLEGFGGHAMAAGIRIDAGKIDAFRDAFEAAIGRTAAPDIFSPVLSIDREIGFHEICDQLLDELESLAPYGEGNPEPVFMARDVAVTSSKIVGGTHRRMVLRQRSDPSGRRIYAIHFNIDPRQPVGGHLDRVAFRLCWNRWNGNKTPQIVVQEV